MDRQYHFGPYTLDPARRGLTRGGTPVALTARAFDVLMVLVERSGRTVEKDELLGLVWPDTVVEEANLSQQVFTIRRLLGHGESEPYIATVPRRGYRFVASVSTTGEAVQPFEERRAAGAPERLRRLAVRLDSGITIPPGSSTVLAISPDGSTFVYLGTHGSTTSLYLRPLDRFEATVIPGSEGAVNPFFSPDGAWIGFQAERRLQRAWLGGGPPLRLCEVADLRGATWTPAGDIVFAPAATSGLWRVPADGGAATPLTRVDFAAGERTHRWPHVTPDGRGVMFTIGWDGATSFDEASIAYVPLEGGAHRLVLRHATDGRLLANGHLAWARSGSVMTAPFDPAAVAVGGVPRLVQAGVAMTATGVAHFACSNDGVLLHLAGPPETLRRSLVTVDGEGRVTGHFASGEALEEPRLAADGLTAIISIRSRSSDLWLYDFTRGALARLTFDGENFAGIWGPGPAMLTFSSSHAGGPSDVYCAYTDRAGAPELLVSSEFDKAPGCWSPDGGMLLFTEYHPDTGADIWVLDRAGQCARPLARTRFNEYTPALAPDGRCVAYTTDESGRPEIQLVSFPEGIGRRQVSTDGGSEPVWSRDGRELFYRSGDRLMRIDMSRGAETPGIPTTVFEGQYVAGAVTLANYDVTPDPAHFVMVQADALPPPSSFCVTIGWFGEVTRGFD